VTLAPKKLSDFSVWMIRGQALNRILSPDNALIKKNDFF
jgi:hypothetical protein